MKKYLIDTNICIFYMKGKFDLDKKFNKTSIENIYISEITLAELKFGVENSEKPEKNKITLDNFLSGIQILPVFSALDIYAKEKARLRKAGIMIDDFDLLIGATSIAYKLKMITNNTDHFKRIQHIDLEDWTKR